MKKIKIQAVVAIAILSLCVPTLSLKVLAAENLVQNASVETVDTLMPTEPEHWDMGGYGTNDRVLTHVALSEESKILKVAVTTYTDGDAKWVFESVPAEGGALYSFSDRYNSNVTSYLYAMYTFADDSNRFEQIASIPSSGGTWMTGTQEFSTPAAATKVSVFHAIQSIGELSTDDYSLEKTQTAAANQFTKGIVSITFDDGWVSQYENAVPVLASANNMPASFYAVSSTFDNEETEFGYMSDDQLFSLQSAGHEVGAHTAHHCNLRYAPSIATCAFAPESGATENSEIISSRNALLTIGITPAETFAYPNGGYTDIVKNLVRDAGISAARSVDSGHNTKFSDKYALKTLVMEQALPLQTVKNWIDDAAANKTWLILTFHQVASADDLLLNGDEGGVTPEYFQEIIAYIAAKQNLTTNGIDVMKVRDVVPFLAGGTPPPPLDTLAPVITLVGSAEMTLTVGDTFVDPGATAADNVDGDITADIIASGVVNTDVAETYTISYNVSDDAGNDASVVTRTVIVNAAVTNTAPTISLVGSNEMAVTLGGTYTEPGATAIDAEDGDLTDDIVKTGSVNTSAAGTYTITYNVKDSAELAATPVTRTVTVTPASSGGSGGGGGGGGGGYFPPITPPVVTIIPTTPVVTTPGIVLGSTCTPLITQNLNMANKKNKSDEVKKLQTFLNKHMNSKLPVTGYFGGMTKAAVMKLQTQYKVEVLTPAKLTKANGNAFVLTRAKINAINCQ